MCRARGERLRASTPPLAICRTACYPDPSISETVLDQGPRSKPFLPNRGSRNASRPQGHRSSNQRPPGIRPSGDGRQAVGNARNNYERYTTMAKDAGEARRRHRSRELLPACGALFPAHEGARLLAVAALAGSLHSPKQAHSANERCADRAAAPNKRHCQAAAEGHPQC